MYRCVEVVVALCRLSRTSEDGSMVGPRELQGDQGEKCEQCGRDQPQPSQASQHRISETRQDAREREREGESKQMREPLTRTVDARGLRLAGFRSSRPRIDWGVSSPRPFDGLDGRLVRVLGLEEGDVCVAVVEPCGIVCHGEWVGKRGRE